MPDDDEMPDSRLAVRMTRHRLRVEARRRGYSGSQARRLVGEVGDKTILERLKEFWVKHKDTILAILKVVMMILPMFLAKEPPEFHENMGMVSDDFTIEMEEAQDELVLAEGLVVA